MKYNLSEITEVIQNRRTIYPEQFSKRKVHKELIEKMLNNAIWAPTHGVTQPWRFRVYSGGGLQELSTFLGDTYKAVSTEDTFKQSKFDKLTRRPLLSSAVIVVSMKRDKREMIAEIEEIEAVSCAIQNIHLSATAYGIGGFWATPKFIYSDKVNSFFELGEKDKCLGIFFLGYPELDAEWPKSQRKPIEYVTEWIT